MGDHSAGDGALKLHGASQRYLWILDRLGGATTRHCAPEHAIEWDASGHVVDLDKYVADPIYGLESREVSDFPAVFWNQDVVAGKRLGVPAQRSARLVLYNKAWARELGFEDAPVTDEGFREQACAAHTELQRDEDPANDGQGGWIVDTHSMTMLSWMVAFGGGVLDGSGYRFLSPKNLEAVAFLKQLYDDACAWLPQTSGDKAPAFAARGALFAAGGLEELSEFSRALAAAENPDEWTVLNFPGPDQPGLVAYGSSFVVFKGTPEQQLASWLFIRWMLSAENQKEWVEATGLFPLRASMWINWRRTPGAIAVGRRRPARAECPDPAPARLMADRARHAWGRLRCHVPIQHTLGRVAEILAIMDRTASDLVK